MNFCGDCCVCYPQYSLRHCCDCPAKCFPTAAKVSRVSRFSSYTYVMNGAFEDPNQGQPEKAFSHFDSPDHPMEFICMDLVGPIHPPSSRGNKYILTVIDMLTGFTMAVPIQNTICNTYRDHIYCTLGGSSRILTDNGSEFKNREMNSYHLQSVPTTFSHAKVARNLHSF